MPENQTTNAPSKTPVTIYAVGALVLITLVGGVIYFNGQTPSEVTPATPLIENTPPIETISPPEVIQEIVEETTPEVIEPAAIVPEEKIIEEPEPEPLPTLDNSDGVFMEKASQLSWLPSFAEQIIAKDLARNFVTFVDNLSRGELAAKFSPVKRPEQAFSVNEIDQAMYIDPISYKRYDAYAGMINSINLDVAIAQLKYLTPLLDEAYMELGYEQGAFIPTLEKAVEEMLQAPVIRNPIKVVAPSAMYKYADPQLENLSDVQKLMLRMGPDNITKLRPKLQQIQLALSELTQ